MWKTDNGHCTAKVNGHGIGVRPMVFFKDNERVASAQETTVLVCLSIAVDILYVHEFLDISIWYRVDIYVSTILVSLGCFFRYGTSTMGNITSHFEALLILRITVSFVSISLKTIAVSLPQLLVDLLL